MIAVVNDSNNGDDDDDYDNHQEEEDEDESFFSVCQSAEDFSTTSFDSNNVEDCANSTATAIAHDDDNHRDEEGAAAAAAADTNHIIRIPAFLRPLLGVEYLPSLVTNLAQTFSPAKQVEKDQQRGGEENNKNKKGEQVVAVNDVHDNTAAVNLKENHNDAITVNNSGAQHLLIPSVVVDTKSRTSSDFSSENDYNANASAASTSLASDNTPSSRMRTRLHKMFRKSPHHGHNNSSKNAPSTAVVVTPRRRRCNHRRGEEFSSKSTQQQQQLHDNVNSKTSIHAIQKRVNELQLSIQKTRTNADQLQQKLTATLHKLDSQTLALAEAQEELKRLLESSPEAAEESIAKLESTVTTPKKQNQQQQQQPLPPSRLTRSTTSPDILLNAKKKESVPGRSPSTEPRCRRHHRPQLEWMGRRRAATADDHNDGVGRLAPSPMAALEAITKTMAAAASLSPPAAASTTSPPPTATIPVTPPTKPLEETSTITTTPISTSTAAPLQEQMAPLQEQAKNKSSPSDTSVRVLRKASSNSFMHVADFSESNEDDDSGVGGNDCGGRGNSGGDDGDGSLYFLDDNLPWVLNKLWRLALSIVTDESDRFRPWNGSTGPHSFNILVEEDHHHHEESMNSHRWSIFPWHEPVNDNVLVWLGDVPHNGHGREWPVVKVRGMVPNTTPRQLVEFLLDSSQVPVYNKMSQGRHDVNVIQESLDTTQEESIYGFAGVAKISRALVKPRLLPKTIETVSMWHARPLESAPGSYMIVNRSVWEEKSRETSNNNSGMLKSEMLLGVMLCRPCRGGPDDDSSSNNRSSCCELTTITHVFPQGVPETMAKRMAPSTAATMMQQIQSHFKNQ